MAKDFKIVEPEFVTKAKQSAVAAVEARFKREEDQRRKVERRARAKGCLAWVILFAVVVAGGVYWASRYYGIGFSEVHMRVQEAILERRYERIEEIFRISTIVDWSTAPKEVKPSNVTSNTIYYAMTPSPDGRAILELTASPGGGMTVRRLSAVTDPVTLSQDAFQGLIAKNPYLIMINGTVYFCSSKRYSKDKEAFRNSLFSPPPEQKPRKGR